MKDCRNGKAGGFGNVAVKGDEKKVIARAFTMTKEEVVANPDVVVGTFLANDILATLLFDSGASMSFVTVMLYDALKVSTKRIDNAFNVEIATGRPTIVSKITDEYLIEIQSHKFPARLQLKTLGRFGVVLGMDWLAKFEASIVFQRKMIQVKALVGSPVTIYGDRVCIVPGVQGRRT